MSCNFLEVFGEYINGYYDELRSSRIISVELYKEKKKIAVSAEFSVLVSAQIFEEVSVQIYRALGLQSCEIEPKFESSLFSSDYFPSVVYEVKKHIPASNGFLSDSSCTVRGDVLKIKLTHGGKEILINAGCDSFIERLILERFGLHITAEFCGETEITSDHPSFKEMLNDEPVKITVTEPKRETREERSARGNGGNNEASAGNCGGYSASL